MVYNRKEKPACFNAVYNRKEVFKIHFKVTCTLSIQSPLLFKNKRSKVISVLLTTLVLTVIDVCNLDPQNVMSHQVMVVVSHRYISCCFLR